MAGTKYSYIRDLRGKHQGDRALILGKGPSVDVWWSRGGCGDDRDSWVVMAVNETVLLPGLAPDYWFWAGPEDSIHVDAHGGVPAGTIQVFSEVVFRERPELARRTAAAYPSIVFLDARNAPDDPYAVTGMGASGTAAFFCAGLWGFDSVLAVGFDAMDESKMRTYPSCMQNLVTEPQNRDPDYVVNNRTIRATIKRFDLDVTFYHRQLTKDEIADARALYGADS